MVGGGAPTYTHDGWDAGCSEDAPIPQPHPTVGTNILPPCLGLMMVLSFAFSSLGFCLQALHCRTLSLQPNRTLVSSM